jgi:hypothetical protein
MRNGNYSVLHFIWNVMAHAQKPDFVFQRNGRVHLNRRGCQFSRLLAAEVCASAVVMLHTPCSEVVWRVLVTRSIRQFPLHFRSHASPCDITFQLTLLHKQAHVLYRVFIWRYLSHMSHVALPGKILIINSPHLTGKVWVRILSAVLLMEYYFLLTVRHNYIPKEHV